jgi:hypothetical protein
MMEGETDDPSGAQSFEQQSAQCKFYQVGYMSATIVVGHFFVCLFFLVSVTRLYCLRLMRMTITFVYYDVSYFFRLTFRCCDFFCLFHALYIGFGARPSLLSANL